MLIPKELFPVQDNNRKQRMCNNHHLTDDESTMRPSSMRRLVKLPLRKHHSFHFQPSQTVSGTLKQTKRMNGPLVFKPFNEKSVFKPIRPVETDEMRSGYVTNGFDQDRCYGNNEDEYVYSITSATTTPRICGTSLKRHISNVETYRRNGATQSTHDNDSNICVTSPSSAASAANEKRLHYADLAPISASMTH